MKVYACRNGYGDSQLIADVRDVEPRQRSGGYVVELDGQQILIDCSRRATANLIADADLTPSEILHVLEEMASRVRRMLT